MWSCLVFNTKFSYYELTKIVIKIYVEQWYASDSVVSLKIFPDAKCCSSSANENTFDYQLIFHELNHYRIDQGYIGRQ